MKNRIKEIESYIQKLPDDKKAIIEKLRNHIRKNLPAGFEETISYGMISYVVPHSLYPDGYHCNPVEPLPFISIGVSKKGISIYHMGVYAEENLLKWFQEEFKKVSNSKLNMGKSCIRFSKMEEIPFELIGKLVSKISVQDWINLYESRFRKNKRK